VVHTKLYPRASERHTPEELRRTLEKSLAALRTEKVELFYLHAPDRTVPWEVTFKAVDELHKEGKFDKV
jgi:aflatoxin B1 aldehyde reductase